MADYNTHVSLSRDTIVEMLFDDDSGQTAYVLAELASRLDPGTRNYADFLILMEELDSDQRNNLQVFCEGITAYFKDTESD